MQGGNAEEKNKVNALKIEGLEDDGEGGGRTGDERATGMGLGRAKRKREKILLEKQTLTSTIRRVYKEATVQCGSISSYDRDRQRFSIHKEIKITANGKLEWKQNISELHMSWIFSERETCLRTFTSRSFSLHFTVKWTRRAGRISAPHRETLRSWKLKRGN